MTKLEIAKEAASWLGTPFKLQGNTKAGCDCVGMLKSIAKQFDVEIILPETYSYYVTDNKLINCLDKHLVTKPDIAPQCGDIVLFKINTHPDHIAFISERMTLIHQYMQARKVVEHHLSDYWLTKIYKIYNINT